jgi:hypothetical protein
MAPVRSELKDHAELDVCAKDQFGLRLRGVPVQEFQGQPPRLQTRAQDVPLSRKVPTPQGPVNSTHDGARSEPRAFFPALFLDRYLP